MEQSELPEDIAALIKAAEDGDPEAQFELGQKYRLGQGVTQSDSIAVDWYRKAAEQGYHRGQNAMGVAHLQSLGVPQDDIEAVTWFRKAAEQGNAVAQTNLGRMYQVGRGVEQDNKESFIWFQRAAKQNRADAQYRIAWIYDSGIGVEKDYKKAVTWYRKSAKQKYAPAQLNLGLMYMAGDGVKINIKKAQELFSQAAKCTDSDVCFDAIEHQDRAERLELSETITGIRWDILQLLKADITTPTMTHYTSLKVGHDLLISESPLRLGHINALNDPNEGKLLWQYLGHVPAPTEGKPVFVGCFLPEEDSLNMWRFYSKNHQNDDACGCAITYDAGKFFDFNLLHEVHSNTQQNESNMAFSNTGRSPQESAAFYRIIYVRDDMDIHGDDEVTPLKALFNELKDEVKKFLGNTPNNERLQQLSRLLGPLPFLLKDADYEAEKEHRIIVTHLEYGAKEIQTLEPVLENGIPQTAPRLYLELHRTNHLEPVKHVTLGPKAPHQEMMAPYWHHKLASEFPDQLKTKPDFYVRASRCAYK